MRKGVALCMQLTIYVCIELYVSVCVHMCNSHRCVRQGSQQKQKETVCRATSNLVIIKDPHFTSSLSPSSCFPPAPIEPKQTIRGDYYEEEKRKGLASRFLKSLDGSLFA